MLSMKFTPGTRRHVATGMLPAPILPRSRAAAALLLLPTAQSCDCHTSSAPMPAAPPLDGRLVKSDMYSLEDQRAGSWRPPPTHVECLLTSLPTTLVEPHLVPCLRVRTVACAVASSHRGILLPSFMMHSALSRSLSQMPAYATFRRQASARVNQQGTREPMREPRLLPELAIRQPLH